MSCASVRIPFCIATLVATSFLAIASASGQENWNGGHGSSEGSTWGAGSVIKKMGAPQMNTSAGASWMPGRQSFGIGNQPGGVWRDAAAMPATTNPSRATSLVVGSRRLSALPGPAGILPGAAGIGFAPMISPVTILPANHQTARRMAVKGPTFGPHFGSVKGGRNPALRHAPRPRPSVFASKSSKKGDGIGGSGSSLGTTAGNGALMPTLTAPSLLPDMPNLQTLPNPDSLSH
jgi:hypothetical protein